MGAAVIQGILKNRGFLLILQSIGQGALTQKRTVPTALAGVNYGIGASTTKGFVPFDNASRRTSH